MARTLVLTLLISGVFGTLFPSPVHGDEIASTTAPTEVATTTPETPGETADEPISEFSFPEASITTTPTQGVLLNNSYADSAWDIQMSGGHYAYFFNGYEALGNPPDTTGHTWTPTSDVVRARIKVAPGTTCDQFRWGGTYGMVLWSAGYTANYESNPRFTTDLGGGVCEFTFYTPIPAGTPLVAAFLSLTEASAVMGSSNNTGTSTTGLYANPIAGGFAFQLCGTDGCSGGFASSTPPAPPEPRISNVLFLPGIEQSRLYRNKIGCDDDLPSCEQSLWNPVNGDTEPDELWLTSDGKSGNPSIFTKERDTVDAIDLGPIQGAHKFYTSFFSDLDTLIGHENWREVTYDWRLSLDDILSHGTQRGSRIYYSEATSTPYIEQTLRELASKSPTGKVTIIAHSNGGLVAKALLRKLGDSEASSLVDKLILVAVPQSGSPQAIGGLLYGYGSALPFDKCANLYVLHFFCGMYVSRTEVRNMALYSPMTYHLLPSQAYFDSVQDPNHSVFSFAGSHSFEAEKLAYGSTIDSWDELSDFLGAKEGGRGQAPADDASIPAVGDVGMIDYARRTHTNLDTWTPPAGMTVYQVAGWGDRTVSGISWYEELQTSNPTPIYKKQYRPIFVEDGDSVVPAPSALQIPTSANVKNIWVDFAREAKEHSRFPKFGHGEIMEVEELRSIVTSILANHLFTHNSVVLDTRPDASKDNVDKLVFILHSPLTFRITNSSGKTAGDDQSTDEESSIPDSDIGYLGEVRYLAVPADDTYSLTLYGHDSGTFSLDIYEETQGNPGPITTLTAIPVQQGAKATISVDGTSAEIGTLQVDLDGDTSHDLIIEPVSGQTVTYEKTSESISHSRKHTSTIATTSSSSTIIAPLLPETHTESNLEQAIEELSNTSESQVQTSGTTVMSNPNDTDTNLTAAVANALIFEQLILYVRNLLTYIVNIFSKLLTLIHHV